MRIFVGAEPNLQPPLPHLLPLNQNRRASPSSWGKMGQRTTRHRLTFLRERHRTTVPAGTLWFSLYLACRDARRLHGPDGMFPNVLYFNFTQPSGKPGFKKKKKEVDGTKSPATVLSWSIEGCQRANLHFPPCTLEKRLWTVRRNKLWVSRKKRRKKEEQQTPCSSILKQGWTKIRH